MLGFRRRQRWRGFGPGQGLAGLGGGIDLSGLFDPRRQARHRYRHWIRTYKVGRWTARRGWTHRRGLAPFCATLTLALLAELAHGLSHGGPLVGALWVWVGIVTGWHLTRRSRRKLLRRWRIAYVAAVYTTATIWLATASVNGFGPVVRGTGVGWLVLAGIPWWWHHRVRHTVNPAGDDREAEWDEHVGKLVPGTPISDITDLEDPEGHDGVIGWQGEAQVPKGKKVSALIAVTEEIAGIYDLEVSDVAIEPAGGRRAKVSVYTTNPLRRVRHWPGPHLFDPETGIAKIATYGDGQAAPYRFYRRGSGPNHDLIAGTTDAGKSRLLDQLLAIERSSPFMASVVIDPQRGQSLPDWKKSCAVFARSVEEGCEVLLAVQEEMYRRNELLANVEWKDEKGRDREGIDHFDPITGPAADLGLPLICLTIEEAHAFKGLGAEKVIEDIGKMARKCGIKLRVVTQVPLLDQLPGSTTLRDMLVGGNVVCFRTANKLSAQVSFNGVMLVDPSLLPREWPDGSTTSGLAYVLGPKPRSAPARSWLVDDPYHWATTGETTELPEVASAVADYRFARTNGKERAETPTRPEATQAAKAVKIGPIPQRILAWFAETESTLATTGTIAKALDEQLNSVSQACSRLAVAGKLRDAGRGLWAPAEVAAEVDEMDEMAGVA